MEEAVVEVLRGGPLILYSWSPDSFLAAVLALAYGSRGGVLASATRRPDTGFLERVAVESRRWRGVAGLGLGWQPGEYDLLAPMLLAPLGVVDNAWWRGRPARPNVFYVNPSPRGDPTGHWPSVASLVSSLLGNPHPFLGAVGVVLALGGMARSSRVYQNMMALAGLDHSRDFDLAMECAMLVYGVVSMGDPGVHGEMPLSLVEASPGDPCKALFQDALAVGMRAGAEEALRNARPRVSEGRLGFQVYHYEIDGFHLHWLAREAALSSKGRALAVVEDRLGGRSGACAWSVRRGDPPLASVAPSLRARGLPAYGVLQGPANYVCVEPSRDPVGAGEAILDALERRYSDRLAEA